MTTFNHPEFDAHELVAFHQDKKTGMRALIAVHNTTLGYGIGGCRVWDYASETDALTDVLRLSRGMTYKNALARLPFGGGKAVIMGNASTKTPQLLRAFGRFVNNLNGQYYTAEDVGVTPADIAEVNKETPYVAGLNNTSGDPSPFTALGVYHGMLAAVNHKHATTSLKGMRIMVQGIGHVGLHLCEYLHQAGAKLLVSDIVESRLLHAQQRWNATIVAPKDVTSIPCDIYAPCALGATLNPTSIPNLKCSVVAGAANNQLQSIADAQLLKERGILYAPDYAINAGGIINIAFENAPGGYKVSAAESRVIAIADTMMEIFTYAQETDQNTAIVAKQLADKIIAVGSVKPLF